jgi:addiction module RelE/StbE family toxin
MVFKLEFSTSFIRDSKKLIKLRRLSKEDLHKVLNSLRVDPFNHELRTHKVNHYLTGACWSSRITTDLRLLWNLTDDKVCINLLEIGGHSGKYNVYK